MIVDTSAIIAMICGEPDTDRLLAAVTSAPHAAMSAPTLVETSIVIDRRPDPELSRALDRLLPDLGIDVQPFTPAQAAIARRAYQHFGKGSGHPAGLNYGDCFAYALAIDTDRPLLFVGDDFTHTDVKIVDY